MKFTYYGQSCFLLETAAHKILFDPFITGNPLASGISIDAIRADHILVSHGHGDHTADVKQIAANNNATVYAMVEVADWLTKSGVNNVIGINFGVQNTDFGKLRTVAALHSSSNPDGSYGGNPAGFVLELEGKTIYFAGDTGLTFEMKLLADLYDLNYAILPIGGHYTMDVNDAIIASKFVNCNQVIGVHYDTFPAISIDKGDAISKFERENIRLLLPAIGAMIEL